MKLVTFCATACLLLLSAGNAAAITYVANRAVGDGTLDLSITTDDTLGVLTSANILDWTLVLTDDTGTLTLEGPGGANNSGAVVHGDQLTATAQDLLFNLDFNPGTAGLSAFFIQTTPIGSVGPFWCVSFKNCGSDQTESFSVDLSVVRATIYTGQFVVASVARTGAVPEPATWSLLIGGFGLAGGALRSRKSTPVAA